MINRIILMEILLKIKKVVKLLVNNSSLMVKTLVNNTIKLNINFIKNKIYKKYKACLLGKTNPNFSYLLKICKHIQIPMPISSIS
jgi:hypothetical protein